MTNEEMKEHCEKLKMKEQKKANRKIKRNL